MAKNLTITDYALFEVSNFRKNQVTEYLRLFQKIAKKLDITESLFFKVSNFREEEE